MAELTIVRQQLAPEKIAWIAGVVDVMAALRFRGVGESGTELPLVAVSTANLAVVNVLADATGMKVTPVSRDYVKNGCSKHCPQAHMHVVSVTGRWSVTGVRATVLLHNLLPYMQVQAEEAEKLVAVGLRSPRKPAVIEKMVRLGWEAPVFLPVQKRVGDGDDAS